MTDDALHWSPGKQDTPRGRTGRLWMATAAAQSLVGLCPQRRVVVQAGGCMGLWPRAFAPHFDAVYTWEPDATNFAVLAHNCGDLPNVYPTRGALGATPGLTGLRRDIPGAGMWRTEGPGAVPVLPLDAYAFPVVDALVLDVEGAELAVLAGAEATLARCRPVIWLEWLHQTDALRDWLLAHGYTDPAPGLGQDWYSLPIAP